MKRFTKTIFIVLRVVIALALLAYLGLSGAINWPALLELARAWPTALIALLLLLGAAVATAWRLCVLLRPHGLRLELTSSLRLTMIGTFFNTCMPGSTGGDLIKIYYATSGNRGRRTEVATIMLLDRAVGMFALVIFPLLIAPFFRSFAGSSTVLKILLLGATGVAAAMLISLVVSWARGVWQSRLLVWVYKRLPLGNLVERALETIQLYKQHKSALAAATGISLIADTLTIGALMLIASEMHVLTSAALDGTGGSAWRAALVVPLGFLANTLPVTPGGLGVGEAAFNQLFVIAGLTGGAEVLIGWRVLSLLLSLSGLVFYLQGRQRFVEEGALPVPEHAMSAP